MSTWLPKNQCMGSIAICAMSFGKLLCQVFAKINFSTVIKLLFLDVVEVGTVMRMKML